MRWLEGKNHIDMCNLTRYLTHADSVKCPDHTKARCARFTIKIWIVQTPDVCYHLLLAKLMLLV